MFLCVLVNNLVYVIKFTNCLYGNIYKELSFPVQPTINILFPYNN